MFFYFFGFGRKSEGDLHAGYALKTYPREPALAHAQSITDAKLENTSLSADVCLWFSPEIFLTPPLLCKFSTTFAVRTATESKQKTTLPFTSIINCLLSSSYRISASITSASQRFGFAGQEFAFTAALDSAKHPHWAHMPSARYSHFLHWASRAS